MVPETLHCQVRDLAAGHRRKVSTYFFEAYDYFVRTAYTSR